MEVLSGAVRIRNGSLVSEVGGGRENGMREI